MFTDFVITTHAFVVAAGNTQSVIRYRIVRCTGIVAAFRQMLGFICYDLRAFAAIDRRLHRRRIFARTGFRNRRRRGGRFWRWLRRGGYITALAWICTMSTCTFIPTVTNSTDCMPSALADHPPTMTAAFMRFGTIPCLAAIMAATGSFVAFTQKQILSAIAACIGSALARIRAMTRDTIIIFTADRAGTMLIGIITRFAGVVTGSATERCMTDSDREDFLAVRAGIASLDEGYHHGGIAIRHDKGSCAAAALDAASAAAPALDQIALRRCSRYQQCGARRVRTISAVNAAAFTSSEGNLMLLCFRELRHQGHILRNSKAVYRT